MKKKKILIVDDEENIRFLYKEELEDVGYNVDLASNALEAEAKLLENKFDLIILDIKMPGMNGVEFLKKLRLTDKKTPVIMCSAYSDYKREFNVWASDDYIVKSSDLMELKNAIRKIFNRK